jgi:hypothetical protein
VSMALETNKGQVPYGSFRARICRGRLPVKPLDHTLESPLGVYLGLSLGPAHLSVPEVVLDLIRKCTARQ